MELFPTSECKFAHCAFPKDRKTVLTDCFDNPKQICLWSIENGEELNRFTCDEAISAFTISQDGSKLAFADLTGSIHLLQVDRCSTPSLVMRINTACGLMQFTSDNECLCCGHLPCAVEDVIENSYGWMFGNYRTFTFCDLTNHLAFASSGEVVLWPAESGDLSKEYCFLEDYLSRWVDNIRSIFPCLSAGFYKKLNKGTILMSGPSFNYIAAVNVDVLSTTNSASIRQVVREIVFSLEGDTIYSISSDGEDNASEVLVSVFRMSSKEILTKKTFTGPSLSLLPTKSGVVLCMGDETPELWNFELVECIQPLTKFIGAEKLTCLSSEVIACQRNRRILTPEEFWGLETGQSEIEVAVDDSVEPNDAVESDNDSEIVDVSSDEDDVLSLGDSSCFAWQRNRRILTPKEFWGLERGQSEIEVAVDDSVEPKDAVESDNDSEIVDVSSDEDDVLSLGDSSCLDGSTHLSDSSSHLGAFTFLACRTLRILVVDIFNVITEEFVSSLKTIVGPHENILRVLVNNQSQLLVCTVEEGFEGLTVEEITFTLRQSNHFEVIWQRSAKRCEEPPFAPNFIFSPEEEFVVTWGSLNGGYGLHILDAKTGKTNRSFIEDHDDIVDCKFVVNGEFLLCCSRDNFLRLLNVRSGELLSMLDVEEQPYSLGTCLGNPLVAVGLLGARLKFVQVELPRVNDFVEKRG